MSVIEPAAGTGSTGAPDRGQVTGIAVFTEALVPRLHGYETGYQCRSDQIKQWIPNELCIGLVYIDQDACGTVLGQRQTSV